MTYDEQYLDALKRVLIDGTDSNDRTGDGTRKTFDVNFNVDLTPVKRVTSDDAPFINPNYKYYEYRVLPALTLRKTFPRTAFHELFWMLRGSTDAGELQEKGIRIWDGNSSREFLDKQGLYHIKEGHIGRGYGRQFRNFNGVDQLAQVIEGIRNNPNSRRHFISLWNPNDLSDTALPPCHLAYNFMVEGNKLHLKFIQRSGDLILGVPMNIMFSAFFLNSMAKWTGLKPGRLAHSITDCHIYNRHREAAHELLFNRTPHDTIATYDDEIVGSMKDSEYDLDLELKTLFHMGWGAIEASLSYEHNDPIPPEMLQMTV